MVEKTPLAAFVTMALLLMMMAVWGFYSCTVIG